MKFNISKPPALNALYGHNKFGSVYLKAKGRAWKEECVYTIRALGLEPFTGEVSVNILLKTCRHQDIDGVLKILFDSIQSSGIIKDDYQIFELKITKKKVKIADEGLEIEIENLNKPLTPEEYRDLQIIN